MVIPFPAYRPTSWELQLPNYRVITNNWRATEAPEILGSLPEDARLRLRYENITDAEALELLLLWRATAGGHYPLNALPAFVASGINDAAMAGRILDIAPLSWVVAEMPRQRSVKAGRSAVDIELKTELRFVPVIPTPAATCPIYAEREDTRCGPSPVIPGGPGGPGGDSLEYSFCSFPPFDVRLEYTVSVNDIRVRCDPSDPRPDPSGGFGTFQGSVNTRGQSFFAATRQLVGENAGSAMPPSGPIDDFWGPYINSIGEIAGPAGFKCGEFGYYNRNASIFANDQRCSPGSGFTRIVAWGSNFGMEFSIDYTGSFHGTRIDRIILREDVPGLGLTGEDVISRAAIGLPDYSSVFS